MSKFIIDTEATSLDNPRVIELGLLNPDNYTEYYVNRGNPGVKSSFEALAVHHITSSDLEGLPPINKTPAFLALNRMNHPDNIIIGHNVSFDIRALTNEGFVLNSKTIDTYKCIYRWDRFDVIPKYTLSFLRHYISELSKKIKSEERIRFLTQEVGLDNTSAHSAVFDCYVNLIVYQFLREHYSDEEMIKISSEPLLFRKLSFGKYKGKTFDEVVIEDRKYLEWLFKSENDKSIEQGQTDEERKNNNLLLTITWWLNK